MIIAGTGHRPDKLGGYSDEAADKLITIADNWLGYQEYKANFVQKVISGGALGWDQALAHAALANELPLVMALPFKDFECKWPKKSQDYLHKLMDNAEVVYVSEPGYAPWKMQTRNQWMVDHADTVLALWNGTSGGTANCIKYAEKVGKPIINLWEQYEQHVQV